MTQEQCGRKEEQVATQVWWDGGRAWWVSFMGGVSSEVVWWIVQGV